jgi:hypothetical protein
VAAARVPAACTLEITQHLATDITKRVFGLCPGQCRASRIAPTPEGHHRPGTPRPLRPPPPPPLQPLTWCRRLQQAQRCLPPQPPSLQEASRGTGSRAAWVGAR